MTSEDINDLRDAIFNIALPTPPAPITSAFMVKINSKRDLNEC
jgi:hypothetical protein